MNKINFTNLRNVVKLFEFYPLKITEYPSKITISRKAEFKESEIGMICFDVTICLNHNKDIIMRLKFESSIEYDKSDVEHFESEKELIEYIKSNKFRVIKNSNIEKYAEKIIKSELAILFDSYIDVYVNFKESEVS